MVREGQARRLIDMVVVDASGDWVGTVSEVFVDDRTGAPVWVTVRFSWFGHGSFIPLLGVDITGVRLRVPYDKATIKAAPRHDASRPLTTDDEDGLSNYYGPAVADSSAPREPAAAGSEGGRANRPRLRRYPGTEEQAGVQSLPVVAPRIEPESISKAGRDEGADANEPTGRDVAVVLHAAHDHGIEVMTVERIPLVNTVPGPAAADVLEGGRDD